MISAIKFILPEFFWPKEVNSAPSLSLGRWSSSGIPVGRNRRARGAEECVGMNTQLTWVMNFLQFVPCQIWAGYKWNGTFHPVRFTPGSDNLEYSAARGSLLAVSFMMWILQWGVRGMKVTLQTLRSRKNNRKEVFNIESLHFGDTTALLTCFSHILQAENSKKFPACRKQRIWFWFSQISISMK